MDFLDSNLAHKLKENPTIVKFIDEILIYAYVIDKSRRNIIKESNQLRATVKELEDLLTQNQSREATLVKTMNDYKLLINNISNQLQLEIDRNKEKVHSKQNQMNSLHEQLHDLENKNKLLHLELTAIQNKYETQTVEYENLKEKYKFMPSESDFRSVRLELLKLRDENARLLSNISNFNLDNEIVQLSNNLPNDENLNTDLMKKQHYHIKKY